MVGATLITLFAAILTLGTGSRGAWSETVFVELAIDRDGASSWLYPYDQARALMMLPYKLAMVISPDGYWAFQFIQFLLLAAIGVLLAMIMITAWGLSTRAATAAGILAVVFGADISGAFSGMVIVRQAIAFWLVALLFLCLAGRRSWLIALLAIPFELAAMFTYDPVILVVAASPVVLLAAGLRPVRALITWYAPIAAVIAWQVWRYAVESTVSYQSEQLAIPQLSEFMIRVGRLIWTAVTPPVWPAQWAPTLPPTDSAATLSLVGFCLSAVVLTMATQQLLPASSSRRAVRPTKGLFAAALLFLAAVIPYLAVSPFTAEGGHHPPGVWRALLLAAIPFAMAAGVVISALQQMPHLQVLTLTVLVVSGVAAGTASSLHERGTWARYVETYRAISAVAPGLRPGTLLVVNGLPPPGICPKCGPSDSRAGGAFASSTWFNSGLHLAFPSVEGLVGTYIDQDGVWAPDMTVALSPSGAHITYANVGVPKTKFAPSEILVIDWNGGRPAIARGERAGWPFPLSIAALTAYCGQSSRATPLETSIWDGSSCRAIPARP